MAIRVDKSSQNWKSNRAFSFILAVEVNGKADEDNHNDLDENGAKKQPRPAVWVLVVEK